MKHEIKTFLWKCDCCGTSEKTTGSNVHYSKPNGWVTITIEASFEYHGGTFDYCDKCIKEAKEKHNRSEDNHYGIILRTFL